MDHFRAKHFAALHFGAAHLAGAGGGLPPLPYQITKFWQQRMFKHKADIWEPVRTAAPGGDRFPVQYLPRYSGVPCWQTRMPSASQVEMFGRTEQDDLFTRDLWFFHEHQPIDDTWLIVLRTVDSHGVNHPEFGKGWICAGDARIFTDAIGDEGHRQIVAVAQSELPEGVATGTEAGGTEAGGTEAGGTEAGGTEAGGTEAGENAATLKTGRYRSSWEKAFS